MEAGLALVTEVVTDHKASQAPQYAAARNSILRLMEQILSLTVFAGALFGQTAPVTQMDVARGTRGEIVLTVSSPRRGDIIDILTRGPAPDLSVVLPDGRALTPDNAGDLDFSWESASGEELPDRYPGLDKSMLPGPGRHAVIILPEVSDGGDFRVRIDAQAVGGATTVAARYIVFRDAYINGVLRMLPGVQISDPVQLPGEIHGSAARVRARFRGKSAGL